MTSMTTSIKPITGRTAITAAQIFGLQLRKHADPIEGAREVTADEARRICAEDPALVYVDSAEVTAEMPADQLYNLRADAAAAGDLDQVALCTMAIDGTIWPGDHLGISAGMAARLATMSKQDAAVACALAIAEAAAQR